METGSNPKPAETSLPADPFRRQYRPLTAAEQGMVDGIKTTAGQLYSMVTDAQARGADARCMALARTKLEEVVFWATKGITG